MELIRKSKDSKCDVRCPQCRTLLAVREDGGISIRRGDMQSIVSGTDFTVSVSCYRCKSLTVIPHKAQASAATTAA